LGIVGEERKTRHESDLFPASGKPPADGSVLKAKKPNKEE